MIKLKYNSFKWYKTMLPLSCHYGKKKKNDLLHAKTKDLIRNNFMKNYFKLFGTTFSQNTSGWLFLIIRPIKVLGLFFKDLQRRSQDPQRHLRWKALQQEHLAANLSILDVCGGHGYPYDHGDIILNSSNNAVFLCPKIYWNR